MIKVNHEIVELGKYPDGTPLLKVPVLRNTNNYCTITWLYENNDELVYLMYLMQHYHDVAHSDVTYILEMPYVPNARADRTYSASEVFTLKYFCNIINSLGFASVKIFDVHSSVTPALLQHVHQENARVASTIYQAIIEHRPDVLFFPDEGSCKRYAPILKRFYEGYGFDFPPVAYANKERNWSDGTIVGLTVQNGDVVNGKNVLIIDDICSKGGTFLHSAKALKALGANHINLYVSHCENTVLEGEMINSGLIEGIFTTNSIFTGKHPIIHVMDLF